MKTIDRTFINENLLFFYISRNALNQMREKEKGLVVETNRRFKDNSVVPNYDETIVNIRYSIMKYKQAFIDEEGNVNIENDSHTYVFNYNEKTRSWTLIEFK